MPSVIIHLPEDVKSSVTQYAKAHDKSVSAACRQLIELGLEIEKLRQKGTSPEAKKMEELIEKHTFYILQNLNLTKEIVRCVFEKEAVISGGDSAEELINAVKEGTKKYIDAYLGRDE
jgi:predicted transcriptional regulator